nr:CDC42 small effector protein 2 isoform X1 [Manis javanica]
MFSAVSPLLTDSAVLTFTHKSGSQMISGHLSQPSPTDRQVVPRLSADLVSPGASAAHLGTGTAPPAADGRAPRVRGRGPRVPPPSQAAIFWRVLSSATAAPAPRPPLARDGASQPACPGRPERRPPPGRGRGRGRRGGSCAACLSARPQAWAGRAGPGSGERAGERSCGLGGGRSRGAGAESGRGRGGRPRQRRRASCECVDFLSETWNPNEKIPAKDNFY